MKLSFGKVLLALSPPSTLKTMMAEEMPFIAPFSTHLNQCFSRGNCDGIQDIINTIGMVNIVLGFTSGFMPCCEFLSDPGIPGPIHGSSSLKLSYVFENLLM